MSAGSLLFVICAIVCLCGALVTVTAKNPIRGAVGLLATIVGIAGLFLKLRAQFLAAIQLIVYAGAVVILFVFVLMLLGSAATAAPAVDKARTSRKVSGVVMGLLSLLGLFLLLNQEDEPTRFPAAHVDHGTVEAVGNLMFSKAVVVFELSTALLIVAVIGAIAVARGKQGVLRSRRQIKNPQDLFVGPLYPRVPEPTPESDANEEAAQ